MDYTRLVEAYDHLEKTSSRLKKVETIAQLFEGTPSELLPHIGLLIQGKVFPAWSPQELGIAQQSMIKAIAQTAGYPEREILARFNKAGDLGLVVEHLAGKRKQQTLIRRKLTVEKVFSNFQDIATVEGKGAVDRKLALVAELLSFATPQEAKYIARTALGTLRIGVAEGVVRDAVAKAFFTDVVWGPRIHDIVKHADGAAILVEEGLLEKAEKKGDVTAFKKRNRVKEVPGTELDTQDLWKAQGRVDYLLLLDEKRGNQLKKRVVDTIEMAWFLRPDYGTIAHIAKERGFPGLEQVTLKVGQPYHVLLSEKSPSLEAALQAYDRPGLEYKYDGARLSIHKNGDRIQLFTRRLENVTTQFPEVVAWARERITAKKAIVEGEMLGFSKGQPMPFQFLSQRIKRKYDIDKIAKEIPVQVNLFDLVYLEGKSLFKTTCKERWEALKTVIKPLPGKFQLVKHLETTDLEKAEAFYREALAARQEGLIVKNLEATYQPGRRVGYWLKVKPTMENLDLVIIGATWGTGKRTGWMGSYELGCRDPATGRFLACGMIGTGIKEKQESGGITFETLTQLLKPHIEKETGNHLDLKPRIVVEVAYEEIQRSPNYASGYALRFPRVVRIREDKAPQQADSRERVERLFELQFEK